MAVFVPIALGLSALGTAGWIGFQKTKQLEAEANIASEGTETAREETAQERERTQREATRSTLTEEQAVSLSETPLDDIALFLRRNALVISLLLVGAFVLYLGVRR